MQGHIHDIDDANIKIDEVSSNRFYNQVKSIWNVFLVPNRFSWRLTEYLSLSWYEVNWFCITDFHQDKYANTKRQRKGIWRFYVGK